MAVKHRITNVSSDGLDLQERVVDINRVAKVVKGGRRFSFTALVVVGDEKSIVGIGYGKANEVPIAIQKGVEQAKKNLFQVPKYKTTITHKTLGRFGSGQVMLKPASPVPESSPVVAFAPCSSSPVFTTSSPSSWVARTRSTLSRQPSTRCSHCAVRKMSRRRVGCRSTKCSASRSRSRRTSRTRSGGDVAEVAEVVAVEAVADAVVEETLAVEEAAIAVAGRRDR